MRSFDTIKYTPTHPFQWHMPEKISPGYDLDEICATCDSIKDREIEKLKYENKKLKKLVDFLRHEIHSLELRTAVSEKAVSLNEMVNEFASIPEGKMALEKAREELSAEWRKLMEQGKMSRIKYYRLLKGIDQITLAKKIGTAQPDISRIERIGYNVPVKTLRQLTKIFGVTMEDLIGT